MLSLAKTASNYDACIRMSVLGNAIGNSIVDNANTPKTETAAQRRARVSNGEFDNVSTPSSVAPLPLLDVNPEVLFTPEPMTGDERRQLDNIKITAGKGDTISSILQTSNPKAIEAFMRANNLTNSTIIAGQNYKMPGEADYAASTGSLGQATLNADNARAAARNAPEVDPGFDFKAASLAKAQSTSGTTLSDVFRFPSISDSPDVWQSHRVFKDNLAGHVLQGLDDMAGLVWSTVTGKEPTGLLSNEGLDGKRLFDAKFGVVLSALSEVTSLARGVNGATVSLYRKMSSTEADVTLKEGLLQPAISGTNSSKYLSESLEKVQAFQNKAAQGVKQDVVEFILEKKGYDALMSSSVNQAGSKGVDAIKYNFEGISSGSGLRNIGIPTTKLDEFNSIILGMKKVPGQ